MPKIVQILPAPTNWEAVYSLEQGTCRTVPLVGWALIEVQGMQQIVGLVAVPGQRSLELVPPQDFLGYRPCGGSEAWSEEASGAREPRFQRQELLHAIPQSPQLGNDEESPRGPGGIPTARSD